MEGGTNLCQFKEDVVCACSGLIVSMGAWPHPMPPYGPPPGWGGWGWGRPTPEEEKDYLDDYIEMLKEELAAAEEYRKELEGSE
jgi:hypothetical protein